MAYPMAMKAGPSSPAVQQPVRHHLPPALMTFPLFRDELGDALAGLDTAEEVLAADPSDAGARDGLSAKVAALSSSLSAAVESRCSEKDIVPRCFEVIDIGRSKFEPVYNNTFEAISSSEEAGAAECSDAVRRLIDAAQGKRATQKSDDVVQLYAAAASIREQVRRLMKAVAGETGAELAEIPEKAQRRHGLKQIVRIVEKCALRPDEPGKAERICDIVRDMFTVSSMEQMAKVAVTLLSCSEIAIVRVKDRNAKPAAGGWRDIMINFVLVGDENAHVCEVLLVHKKMLLQRREMGGHLYYGRVRIATEVLEKLRFLESSERRTRVKELHAAGTTTAATLKHIGVPLADLLHGGFPANELRAAGYPQAEILAVLSPAECLRAAQACHELVPNAAQPSEAETLAGYLNHNLLRDEAVAALLSAKGAVAKLMSLAADAAVPAEARVLIMDGVLTQADVLSQAAFREGGALDKCLAILASTDAPQLVHAAARKMLGAAADRADVDRREDAIAQLVLQPGSDAAGAARTLANIAGRREALNGSTFFDGRDQLLSLQTKPGALKAMVTWLQAAPPGQAAHLAEVVAAIAPTWLQAASPVQAVEQLAVAGDDARLLNVDVIAALLSHLPAASSTEALALIAASPVGQERLWQANAIPKLLEVATGKDHSAAVHAARAIGSLAVHATGRDAMGKLVARAKESDAALELLGEAMQQDAAAALAAEAHGALELLCIAVGKQGVSATAVLAAARMALHGTRAQVLALIQAGVVEAAAAMLRRANVSREDQSVAWRAVDTLIPAADEARERARHAGVVELLSGAFERADAAAYWALQTMGKVAGSDVGAVAIIEAGLAERVAALIKATEDEATEDDTAREVAHLAAKQLADIVQRQKGAAAGERKQSQEHELGSSALARALGSSDGVPWRQARLMVRGVGGVGKSSTIDAMAGKTFDAQHKSTVGTGLEELELVSHDLAIGAAGGALKPYERTDGEDEYALALAAHAASLIDGKGAANEQTGQSMLGAILKPKPRVPKVPQAPTSNAVGAPATTSPLTKRVTKPAPPPKPPTPPHPRPDAEPDAKVSTKATKEGPSQQEAPSPAVEPAAKVAAAPDVSPELVIRFKNGQLQSNLVLRVQDTGGQPIFLTILELLTTPEGTVYMVVFSLAKLQEDFATTLETTSAQLKSIQVFAAGAPIILAGTRRDEVKGGEAELTKLSDKLLDGLQRQCAPAIAGLERDPATGRCFFGIENSKGYQGDATIRNLVKAVEVAAYKLPSMQQKVPLEWLRVHDELRKVGQVQRRVRLDAVRAIATKHGLPHTGFTLDEELSAMLTFFHSLNSILWYDSPSLRDLVVLDPQWVIDAVTCFIRDFKLEDHTKGHRTHALDQKAIREEPEAWEMLTKGKATLQRKLLNILWSGEDFKEHKPMLLDLMTRFSLAVPVPKKSDEWLVPALLVDVPSSEPPRNWPPACADAAALRVHFAYEGAHPEDKLLFSERELSAGFMPNAVFDHVCCGAFAASEASKFGVSLERSFAYVLFDKELITLRRLPSQSSILVSFQSNGKSYGSLVIDRLRVLLSDALSEYRNLRSCILAPLADGAKVWVAIDVLSQTRSDAQPARAPDDGRMIPIAKLKQDLSLWLTQQCEFNFVLAEKLRSASHAELPKMLSLQMMREKHPDWIVKRTISFEQACLGSAYPREYLAISHRWETSSEPDSKGAQLKALVDFLNERPEILYVFYDLMSLPQGTNKTPAEKAEFGQMLPNINLLYLGCSVLILLDRSYSGRFWTMYEAWLSFMMATNDGLLTAPEAEQRCKMKCLHGCPPSLQQALREEWEGSSARSTYEKLSEPDVDVTNQSDKEMQLPKILVMNQMVIDIMGKRRAPPSSHASAAGSGAKAVKAATASPAAAGATADALGFLDKVKLIKESLGITASTPKDALEEANTQMGLATEGPLPKQADVLIVELGL